MPVSFATIRSRFATKINSLPGFSESRNPFDDFNRNPNPVANLRFSIGISDVDAMSEQRESLSVGILCNTKVLVKFPYRLRPKDQISDYDNSMNSAQSVISSLTIRQAPLHSDLQIFFSSFSHEITNSGEWIINTLEFNVLHTINL